MFIAVFPPAAAGAFFLTRFSRHACSYLLMTHEQSDDRAACRMLTERAPLVAVMDAEYAPPCAAPQWAAQFVGVRTRWFARFILDDRSFVGQWAMTPWASATGDEDPVRWVPLEHLRAIELVGLTSANC